MQIVNQLGELFLEAVPTVIIVFLFYLFMSWAFFKPLLRVLEERRRRAEGARAEAEQTRGAVQQKLRTYNDAVKKARTEIFSEQEAQRRRTLDDRQAKINNARAAAQSALQEAKKSIAADVQAARVELEQSSGTLANDIAEAILAGISSGPGAPGKGPR